MSAMTTSGYGGNATTELNWMLSYFAENTPGVTETVAVSSDGFVLAASAGVAAAGIEQLAAIISGLTSLTQGTANLYELDDVRQIIVEMEKGFLFVMSVSDGSAIGTLTTVDCDIGALGYEMTLLTGRVGELLTPDLVDTLKNVLTPAEPRATREE